MWPGMPFPNLDGRIHQSLVLIPSPSGSFIFFGFDIFIGNVSGGNLYLSCNGVGSGGVCGLISFFIIFCCVDLLCIGKVIFVIISGGIGCD